MSILITILMKISLSILKVTLIAKEALLAMMITKVVSIKIVMTMPIPLSIETVRFQVTPMSRALVIGVATIKVIKIGKGIAIGVKILIEIVPSLTPMR